LVMPKPIAQTLDAVFEDGTFKPVNPEDVDLAEGQQVRIIVKRRLTPKEVTELAGSVYDGLSAEEISEIEHIALDRSNFFDERTSEH
jgi:predicted DNA-binding antitoxin AbrB/MazE fold protein